jgi:hypothetical protein
MPSLAVSVRERSGTPDVSPSEYLEEMFIAALLLTGSAEVAEEAVLEASNLGITARHSAHRYSTRL